ncbi:2-dehydro-3-deoxy-phosphogluconate aldolase [Nitratireductor sp. ZSWI3]|uniref:2-dehydro-3-deoxy-phosphogluconate aldolase n=1 Tax=Nitratireductor sp. ZSWI3 TaxID=2966359 RepID=UPI00214F701C|nr:2-dehydro-3-deoxy-phosphogluconate aldolase [Nitratireductor sp. ZSWI3]MCR4264986.1 2-dehydro-3-deoxy-phosphogluconate aldolase [Nitratireductor sp. ZSWI3]
MHKKDEALLGILEGQPVIPVLKIDRLADAVPLAQALVRGGLPAIEITLRTPDAIDAIRLVSEEVPDAIVGAGTILTSKDFSQAVAAGARFIVSPGITQELLDVASMSEVPFLPGAATPSEVMAAREEGYRLLKFFPAEQAGGAPFLKALSSPLATIRFCPTGGISLKNVRDYLSLPNVICVGGSWVAPEKEIAAGNWAAIEELAREARSLR